MMKKSVLLALATASGIWVACENTIRYDFNPDDGQITILSQMYTSETEHRIFLSMSYPDRTDSLPGANVVCWVGGEKFEAKHVPVPIEQIREYDPETGQIVTVGQRRFQKFDEYRFSATIRPGDVVRVEASKGKLKAWAQVTAPQPATVVRVDTSRVTRTLTYSDFGETEGHERSFMDMAVTIRDVPGEDNYFFMKGSSLIEGEFRRYDASGTVDSTALFNSMFRHINYSIFHDPVLEDGYAAGENGSLLSEILPVNVMNCFSDKAFRDGEVVVHPSFDIHYFLWRDYNYTWACPGTDDGELHGTFSLHLRTISRDFYNYLRAINNMNAFGYEVSPIIEPVLLPNNVTGGYGLVSVGSDDTYTLDLGSLRIVHGPSGPEAY